MYKLCFYVPKTHLESVKNALFKKGAGTIGTYEHCAWQTLGTGTYRPTTDSNPYQGTAGSVETAEEYQVEMVCEDRLIKTILKALIKAHPYETPAHSAWKITTLDDLNE